MALPKATSLAPSISPEERSERTINYVAERITQAADKGYPDTKCWVYTNELDLVLAELKKGGYGVTELVREEKRVQLGISW